MQDIVADDTDRDPGATCVLPWTQKPFDDALKAQTGQVGHARYSGVSGRPVPPYPVHMTSVQPGSISVAARIGRSIA
jgi:hypothetical protein